MDDTTQDNIKQEEAEETEAVQAETDEVDHELQALKNLASQLDNNYKRALADYQNLQRRTQEEKKEWIGMASKDMVLKFLPVFDTLALAQKHLQDKGLALSIHQFLQVLEDEGITQIQTKGKEFDPSIMEAVTTTEVEKKEKGKVVDEVRTGFLFGETVLRPAQVVVGA